MDVKCKVSGGTEMTVSEIAKLAGVSKACVSRYFNHGYVSEEKKKKIKAVVEQTGYVPAKKMQSQQVTKPTIGVIIPKINSESISRMIASRRCSTVKGTGCCLPTRKTAWKRKSNICSRLS